MVDDEKRRPGSRDGALSSWNEVGHSVGDGGGQAPGEAQDALVGEAQSTLLGEDSVTGDAGDKPRVIPST
jgi:hypothetical protein